MGAANAATWLLSFLLTLAFQSLMIPMLGTSGTFAAFTVVVAASAVYLEACLIETKGKTLEEIEASLAQ